MTLTVLVVEPEEKLRASLRTVLKEEGHRVWAFAAARGATEALTESDEEPELAFLSAGTDGGMDALLARLRTVSARCQRIWIAPPESAAVDQLAATLRPRGLLSRSDVIDQVRLIADRVLRSRERGRALATPPPMLGESPAIVEMRALIDRVALGGARTVLITGESGTGKDVAARRLHALGARAHGPFVEVDCASIPTNLLESELFGHEPGAFTDARSAKIGLLELAQGGTAFLDEIGELDLGLQAKLLRVLDSRRMRRLGGRDEIPLDIHLTAATNRDLAAEVREGAFRTDLYYRLDVVRLQMAPVRERPGDAWLLSAAFLEEAARRLGRGTLALAPGLLREIEAYPWPGNVREIRNQMERIALMAEPGSVVSDLDLPRSRSAVGQIAVDFSRGPLSWEEIERAVLEEALRSAQGNVSEAARLLGLGRGALRYRLSRHGLQSQIEEDSERRAA